MTETALIVRKKSPEKVGGIIGPVVHVLHAACGGANKAKIMCKANIAFEEEQLLLDFLLKMGLIRVDDSSGENFHSTEKGDSFIRRYERIKLSVDSGT